MTKAEQNRPRRVFFWQWPKAGQAWFMCAFQNYGSRWIHWRFGPLNYDVEIAAPGQKGGWIGRARAKGDE